MSSSTNTTAAPMSPRGDIATTPHHDNSSHPLSDDEDDFYNDPNRRAQFLIPLPACLCCLLPCWAKFCRIPSPAGAQTGGHLEIGNRDRQPVSSSRRASSSSPTTRTTSRRAASSNSFWTRFGNIKVFHHARTNTTLFIGPNYGFSIALTVFMLGLAYHFFSRFILLLGNRKKSRLIRNFDKQQIQITASRLAGHRTTGDNYTSVRQEMQASRARYVSELTEYYENLKTFNTIVFVLLAVFTHYYFFKTCLSDPGVVANFEDRPTPEFASPEAHICYPDECREMVGKLRGRSEARRVAPVRRPDRTSLGNQNSLTVHRAVAIPIPAVADESSPDDLIPGTEAAEKDLGSARSSSSTSRTAATNSGGLALQHVGKKPNPEISAGAGTTAGGPTRIVPTDDRGSSSSRSDTTRTTANNYLASSSSLPYVSYCNKCDPDGSVLKEYFYPNVANNGYNLHHCEFCDTCIQDFDHHCPWTGKCIGAGNIVSFYRFLSFSGCTILYMVVIVLLFV
ncbi:unnamed protein product [Amoebophrya sp. A120]|nr:unnamed protein product [Amoebophrya sp. A120]|eukprot:GSA120T00023942001.1